MHPRFRPLRDLKKIADHLAARFKNNLNKPFTRAETIGVILMLNIAIG